jgi:hypothetical protein
MLTAVMRPRISLGVRSWLRVLRIAALTVSAAPKDKPAGKREAMRYAYADDIDDPNNTTAINNTGVGEGSSTREDGGCQHRTNRRRGA